ncbi:MAG: hypothetical protein AAF376_08765 [Pseudomonadota bacterium]
MAHVDPDLIGIWIARGSSVTYEVDADGGYHVADPEEPVNFAGNGSTMVWGGRLYVRHQGAGNTPVGRWIADASTDAWLFRDDGTYDMTDGSETFTGIWSQRHGGHALWTRELRAHLQTSGAEVGFQPVEGGGFRYGYTVVDGVWTLLDPQTWRAVARYVSPQRLARSA